MGKSILLLLFGFFSAWILFHTSMGLEYFESDARRISGSAISFGVSAMLFAFASYIYFGPDHVFRKDFRYWLERRRKKRLTKI